DLRADERKHRGQGPGEAGGEAAEQGPERVRAHAAEIDVGFRLRFLLVPLPNAADESAATGRGGESWKIRCHAVNLSRRDRGGKGPGRAGVSVSPPTASAGAD